MMKILTIAVCAYNMEDYLANCLDSFLIPQSEKLEVLIMNDGSKDRTAEIAEEYQKRYPDTFVLVNKENGGWGSNLNMAVTMAKGKYFKEVDADDWVDREVLDRVVSALCETDVDMYITSHTFWNGDTTKEYNPDWKPYAGKTMEMKDAGEFYFPIWDAAFKTEILRANYVDLPKKVLYTDNLVVLHAVPFMETVHFNEESLYNYRLGRDGQSVDIGSMFKHYKDLLTVWHESVEYYLSLPVERQENKHCIAKMDYNYRIFMDYFIHMYKLDKPAIRQAMLTMEEDLKRIDSLYKKEGRAKRIKLLRATGFRSVALADKLISKKKS